MHWERKPDIPLWKKPEVAVLLQDKIYVSVYVKKRIPVSELYCTTTALDSWTKLGDLDIMSFGLCTYQLKLVMVGGASMREKGKEMKIFNHVLLSKDGITWEPILPPMPTRRSHPAVVNTGNPEYLVVAGGLSEKAKPANMLDVVEVFIEGQWFAIKPLLIPCYIHRYCVHDGKLVFDIRARYRKYPNIYCDLHTLLAHCTLCKSGKKPTGILWKTIDREGSDIYSLNWRLTRGLSHFFSGVTIIGALGGKLISSGGIGGAVYMYAHSSTTRCWVHVGELPEKYILIGATVPLGTEELAIMGSKGSVFKVSLRGN